MGIEIERKFLVDMEAFTQSEEWKHGKGVTAMTQGYFSSPEVLDQQKASMRVRIEYGELNNPHVHHAPKAWLNVKSCNSGHTRQEFEYQIPVEDAEELLKLCVGSIVRKVRYRAPSGDLVWEVDQFSDDNDGLVVAEIELPSADHPFEKPAWIGREVTDDLRYTNVALSSHPFKDWT